MPVEKESNSINKDNDIRTIEAYEILLQRQINEDRIIVERTSIFLLASSFLFMAFVGLLNVNLVSGFQILRIVLPVVGLFTTVGVYHLNVSAANALEFWHKAQLKIEDTAPNFAWMMIMDIAPHVTGRQCSCGEKKLECDKETRKWSLQDIKGARKFWRKPLLGIGTSHIYVYYLPGIFLVLWLASLVLAIIYY